MIHKSYSTYSSTRYKILSVLLLQQSITTAVVQQIIKTTVVLCSRLFDTASCIETQSMCPATHDGGYFSSSLQQHMGDFFFRISLTADGPQRTRLPVSRKQRRHLAYGHEAKIK